ncbi:MAG: hypothetical protein Q8P57_01575 [Candidatus Pacearchaeota archaeon]|nr:hypothetical protein [Candidatus Pacearchaeota archaeon]
MKREIQLGNRILFLECLEVKSGKIYDKFLDFLLEHKEEFDDIMDKYDIPQNVVLNFKNGGGDLAGMYHVQGERVRRHVIVIDIYAVQSSEGDLEELIDTFVHEIIHHKINDDSKTDKITEEIVGRLFKKVYKSV